MIGFHPLVSLVLRRLAAERCYSFSTSWLIIYLESPIITSRVWFGVVIGMRQNILNFILICLVSFSTYLLECRHRAKASLYSGIMNVINKFLFSFKSILFRSEYNREHIYQNFRLMYPTWSLRHRDLLSSSPRYL